MSFNEPYFAPISNYSNTNKGMPLSAQEEWLNQFPQKRAENKPNGGIVRSVVDTRELFLREMNPKQRKAARAQAKREHAQALKNLAKQEQQDAKEIAKQIAEWRAEEAQQAKESKKPIKRGAKKKMSRVAERQNDIVRRLKRGEQIRVADYETKTTPSAAYQMQVSDFKAIKATGIKVLRVRAIKSTTSYLFLDNLDRYDGLKMSGSIFESDGHKILKVLNTGKLLLVDSLTSRSQVVARSMLRLVDEFGINISTVYDNKNVIGYIIRGNQK